MCVAIYLFVSRSILILCDTRGSSESTSPRRSPSFLHPLPLLSLLRPHTPSLSPLLSIVYLPVALHNSDMTVIFESLLKSVARAFYPDPCVLLVDVLLRDKYLRDDADMESRLKVPLKELRKALQHLVQEQIVKKERVDDLEEGGSRATEFFYIDYYHVLQVITYRLHLLRKGLSDREKAARGTGVYECPNYKRGRCEGRYTNLEAQSCYDDEVRGLESTSGSWDTGGLSPIYTFVREAVNFQLSFLSNGRDERSDEDCEERSEERSEEALRLLCLLSSSLHSLPVNSAATRFARR